MRKLTGFALAVLALSATCALAQGNASSGILYASDFNAWTLPQANTPTAGMIQWPSAAICHISSNGYSFVAVKVGRPLTIVDVDPSLTETVTPVAVTTSGGSCTVTAPMTFTHVSYSVRSGTGGLQEAIDYSIPMQGGAVVVLTPAWTAGGGQSGMVTAATGQTNTSILDQRVSTLCAYSWNGSAYAAAGCGAGGLTGVTAGAGITGGGVSGNVSVAADSTVLPFLNLPNTFTQANTFTQPVTASGGVVATLTGHATLDLPLTGGVLTGNLKLPSILQGGPTIDVRFNGALCDGTTDDTAAYQTTANTAHGLYVATGQKVGVRTPSTCVVAGTVTALSGVNYVGPGTIIVPDQTAGGHHPTLLFNNADSVGVEGLTIKVVTPCPGNDATCSAIQWLPSGADAVAHKHVSIRNNTIVNADWGVLIGYYGTGSGSLSDVDISGNGIESPSGSYSNADGIHVAGRVSTVTIANNRISNRNDAGIGLTSEAGNYVISGVTVTGNVLKETRVGIDCSGCTDTSITGNFAKATIAAVGTSNPAFREIYYNGYPSNVLTSGNYFENPASVDGNVAKIDPVLASQVSWPSISSTFIGNTLGGNNGILYARGNGISIANNTFLIGGGGITLDYDGADNVATANVTIGTNRFQGAGVVTFGAGCALYSGIAYFPQEALGTLTVSNLSCIGTQTFSTPGDLLIGGNLKAPAGTFTQSIPGAGSSFDFVWRDPANTTNHMILDSSGNLNVAMGWIATAQYFKMGGGGSGGLRNSSGTVVVPGSATDFMGTSATVVAMADAKTMTTGDCLQVGVSGGLADSGSPCGGGGGGGNATSLQSVPISATGPTSGQVLEYNGTNWIPTTVSGTGTVTSVGLTVPSWLSVAGSPVTAAGTLAVTATGAQTANRILATPDGAPGAVDLRAMVANDVPALPESRITNLTTDLAAKVATSTTVNGHALSASVVVSASDLTTGTLPHAQLPALVSGDIPNNAANTTGTSGGLTGTPAITVSSAKATTFYTGLEFCANGGSWPSCTACTTAATINPANGSKQRIVLTNAQTCALTFTQPVGETANVQVTVIQSSAGSFNGLISGCTWPGGAGGGVAPVITPLSGAVDSFTVSLDTLTARCQIAQAFK